MNEDTLEPCPFCGGEAVLFDNENTAPDHLIRYWVVCSCGTQGHRNRHKNEAIKAWNTRATQPQWQDISTAPKDGEVICYDLGWSEDSHLIDEIYQMIVEAPEMFIELDSGENGEGISAKILMSRGWSFEEPCKCDVTISGMRGIYCHYLGGCQYEKDCKIAEESFDDLIKAVDCNDSAETGSRIICSPPVTDTDEDWVFDCSNPGQMIKSIKALKSKGFYTCNMKEDEYDDIMENFTPLRFGHLNFILCNNAIFYRKFVFATDVAREMNILEKDKRIILFQAILYGKLLGEEY